MPSFGDPGARLLVVGLAPGRRGANRTGRVFTGDGSGVLLFAALARHGLSTGRYGGDADDGLRLCGCMITNAVRCLPPGNRPAAAEIAACRGHLAARIRALPELAAILTLGRVAHDSTLRALGAAPAALPFAHGAEGRLGTVTVFASYHCSRYNVNTRRLTPEMFDALFLRIRDALAG
ncbi:uracil-DNA glycosylase [Paralimibaculum aggregatum]|uniref:Type-5 uracil-DNA glycosylase n=1 Tax=Paralimibaculum aggregatum TaxID=3036245 RepID=A0ABQ6LC43_9RHOB|nr:uracil-DNA glycosylase [Limibaculum sp. NKW23]GMG80956.1 uracil-DNA glycosylase [Limibaculum sp. NKW23]